MNDPTRAENLRWLLARGMGTDYPAGPRTLTLGAIIGIAVGGALLLFAFLAALGIWHAKRKHRREKQNQPEASEDGNGDMDLKTAIRCTRPPGSGLGRRSLFKPFLPVADGDRKDWAKDDGLQMPPLAKSKSVKQRSFFRTSSVRDSWPLISNKPLGFLPSQSSMVLSPVAPPGYVVQDPKLPKRTASLMGRKNSQDSTKAASPARDPDLMGLASYREIHRRSTSENQLSTILRSTSQRLRAAQRQSLTRTLSTMGRFPGLPPSERLPTPPRKAAESREGLVDTEFVESVGSSIYDAYALTPSPAKKGRQSLSQRSPPTRSSSHSPTRTPARPKSPTSSAESRDSLCEIDKSDLVVPSPLTSPSKIGLRAAKRQSIQISARTAKDISSMIHKDSRASKFPTGTNTRILDVPQHVALDGDPFYSSVRSSKPLMPIPFSQIQGPRPMYIRKATFGQEATLERPASFSSPLRDVSGNAQTPPKKTFSEPADTLGTQTNPFQWSPQEAMQTRATQTSPKRLASRTKGHKRSNVVRISNLSRPTSTVDVVPEEPEEVSPLRLKTRRYSSFLAIDSGRSSPANTPPVLPSCRPPSVSRFSPTLVVAGLSIRSEDDSPTLGSGHGNLCYSPTLSGCDYYAEKNFPSDDEFSNLSPKSKAGSKVETSPKAKALKERCQGRNYSADPALFPTKDSQQGLLSFPPPPLAPIFTPRPASRLLQNKMSTMSGLSSTIATPAPPVLTIPDHLLGPRSEPGAEAGKHTHVTLSPPHVTMVSTIGRLRRMNSEVSTLSCTSLASNDNDSISQNPSSSSLIPDLARDRDRNSSGSAREERDRSRGSQHYLSLGQPTSPISHSLYLYAAQRNKERTRAREAPEKRDSHRIHKDRRRKRAEAAADEILELTPVREVGSPESAFALLSRGSNSPGLRFPTLSYDGKVGATLSHRARPLPVPRPLPLPLPLVHQNHRANQNQSQNHERDPSGTSITSTESDDLHPSPSPSPAPESDKYNDKDRIFSTLCNAGRWSDAMSKPVSHAVRRESNIQQPVPTTPPKMQRLGMRPRLAGVGLLQKDSGPSFAECGDEGITVGDAEAGEEKGEDGGVGGSTDCPDCYDTKGFLINSPDRKRVLAPCSKAGSGSGAGVRDLAFDLEQKRQKRMTARQRQRESCEEKVSGFLM
ncbi:hypothetical protein B2J93_9378 [Marssonina coronariae]|uniref:Uncharacterized protein n=1 Tax=Diplocarpon coronariae TaxID=2795749 RepID=A0A218Z9P4_9HELO|nr:hypothetical protein B2J93_9378 [Marssonina coronariae]